REQNALAASLGIAAAERSGGRRAEPRPAGPRRPHSGPATRIARPPEAVAAERQLAAGTARIGLAQAAWLPDLSLDRWGGVQSGSLSGLFDAPARVWSVGPSLAQTLFDGGRRAATRDMAIAQYDEQAAFYRQTVLDSLRE